MRNPKINFILISEVMRWKPKLKLNEILNKVIVGLDRLYFFTCLSYAFELVIKNMKDDWYLVRSCNFFINIFIRSIGVLVFNFFSDGCLIISASEDFKNLMLEGFFVKLWAYFKNLTMQFLCALFHDLLRKISRTLPTFKIKNIYTL